MSMGEQGEAIEPAPLGRNGPRAAATLSGVVASPLARHDAPRPGAPLRRFVDRIDVISTRPTDAPRAVEYMPDGTASLVFRALGAGAGDVGVRGPCTRAHYKVAPPIPRFVRVVFRPGGAYPFFGVPIDELSDQMVPLVELWGSSGTRLCELLLAAASDDEAASLVEDALVRRMRVAPFEPAGALAARAAVALLAPGDRPVDDVARALGISERHLRRAFRSTVGMAPRTFTRVARFQRALALGAARPGRWNEVARAAGYFDQAHLTGDFNDLARVSPAAYAAGRRGHVVACGFPARQPRGAPAVR
jgi:AraC-like DNA-binding protein